MANVRLAFTKDIPAILEMAAAMHTESPHYCRFNFSEEKLYHLALALVTRPEAGGILVAEDGDRVVGMFALVVDEHYFGTDKQASDIVVYVRPEHRGSRVFLKLVTAFEKRADELGAKEKVIGVSACIHAGATVAVLERLGYKQFSTGLTKA